MDKFTAIEIAGIAVNVSNIGQALEEISELIEGNGRHYVCFFEGNMLHWAYSQREIRDVLNSATLCYPDGIAVAKLASWRLGRPIERVPGPTFILKACEYGVAKGWRHYFYGGKEGVAEELKETLTKLYPGLQVAGTMCPPFREPTEDELDALSHELQEKKVDLLWVALGGPRQEKWMHKYLGRIPVPVMLGVGAAFDFHTEHQAWAPKWIRAIGMEWLWRMTTGGKRVFVRNFICVSHVAVRLFFAYLGRLKYMFVKHPSSSRHLPNTGKWQMCKGCDGVPCSQSFQSCPRMEKRMTANNQ